MNLSSGIIFLALLALSLMAVWLLRELRVLRRVSAAREQELCALKDELAGLTHGSWGMGGRLVGLEQGIRHLREAQERPVTGADSGQPYGPAIRMVQGGASIEDLIETCGLSQAEAELVYRMHGAPVEL